MKTYSYKAKAIKFNDEGLPGLQMNFSGTVKAETKEDAEIKVRKGTFKEQGMLVVSISSKVQR